MGDGSTEGEVIKEETSVITTLGNYTSHSSRCFFVEAFKAFVKCLGFEWITQARSSSPPDTTDESAGSQEPSSTTTITPEADPPTATTEDPTSNGLINVLSAPTQPPVSTGRGRQIN